MSPQASRGSVDRRDNPKTASRNLNLLVAGNTVSAFGNAVYLITVTLLLKSLTESIFMLGVFQFVALAPAFLLSPVAGAIIDRTPRRSIIVAADLGRGVVMIMAGVGLFAPALRTPVFVLAVSFVAGVGNAVFIPAVLAFMPQMVRSDRLHAATGLRAATNQAANLVGNAAGGVLFAALGAPLLFLMNGLTFILSGVQECSISVAGHPGKREHQSLFASARDGLVAAGGNRTLRFLIASQAGLFVVSPVLLLSLPFIVIDELQLSERLVGVFFALALAGGIGAFLVMRLQDSAHMLSRPVITVAYAGLAVGFVGVGITTTVPVLVVVALVSGAAAAMVYLYTTTWVQLRMPTELHGRIFALLEATTALVAPTSYLIFGALLETIGPQTRWVLFVILGGLALLWSVLSLFHNSRKYAG